MFEGSEQKREAFVSYTKYMKDRKQKEIKQIHMIKSKNEKKQKSPHGDIQLLRKKDDQHLQICKAKVTLKEKTGLEKQQWIQIDDKAAIVKGKLVYMEQERRCLKEANNLIDMLKENEIRIKEYIYGDRSRILREMQKNQEDSKNEEVERYINKNMKEQNVVKANHSSWYDQVKESLFSDK